MKEHKWKWLNKLGMYKCSDCGDRDILFGRRGSPERFDNQKRILDRTDCDAIFVRRVVHRILGKPKPPENVARTRL